MIAVTFALPAESSNFIKLLRGRTVDGNIVCGELAAARVEVVHVGVGETESKLRIRRYLAAHSPDLLISSGFAGALTDQLRVSDLLLAQNFTAPDLLAQTRSALGERAHVGTLATATAITDAAAERQELAVRTGAIAVDMETKFIAEACRDASVSVVALRAISDTPAAPLPAPPHVLFDVETQTTKLGALSFHIATHPGALLRLVAFARKIASARQQLAAGLAALVADQRVRNAR